MNERSFQVDTDQQCEWLQNFIARYPIPFSATIGPLKQPRSLSQNARLWLLHTAAGNHLGYAPDEMHELALCKFFGYTEGERKNPFTGEIERRMVPNKRSSARDKTEFAAFMTQVETWYGSAFGIWLE